MMENTITLGKGKYMAIIECNDGVVRLRGETPEKLERAVRKMKAGLRASGHWIVDTPPPRKI